MHGAFAEIRRLHVCRTFRLGCLFPLLLFSGCQAVPPAMESAVTAEAARAQAKASAGAPRFVLDPQVSQIRLLVYRAGALSRFGHNHVITGRVRGEIRAGERAADSSFRLEVPVESFIVDPPEARTEEGEEFAAEVSEQARRATRDNMLGGTVLDAARAPLIEISSVSLVGPRWNPTVHARVRLRGVVREVRFSAAVVEEGDVLTIIASLRIRQSDFGLAPFSVLGGGLRVADEVDIRLHLVARRARN